jgi:hypothetical protein
VTTEISRAACHLHAALYIFPRARERVVARVPTRVFMREPQGAARRDVGGTDREEEEEGGRGSTRTRGEHDVSYLRAYWRIIQAVNPLHSHPHLPPPLLSSRTVPNVTSCDFVLALYFRGEVYQRQSRARCIVACVRACVHACVSVELYEKSHFAYLRPLKARETREEWRCRSLVSFEKV